LPEHIAIPEPPIMARRTATDHVEADLPITPMLDMSFQLLAFFIITFRPSPTEAQIPTELPPAAGSSEPAIVFNELEKPARYIVQVQATEQGTIAKITVREDLAVGDRELGNDAKVLLKELKVIHAAESKRRETAAKQGIQIPPPKMTLEIADKLLQASVVQVFDASRQAGFTDIATVPIDKKKR